MATTTGTAQPNVTPLIDVLLTLLVIFMVITPATPKGETAVVPRAPEITQPQPVRAIVVQVLRTATGDTALRINNEAVTWQTMQARLTDIFKLRAEKAMFVTADDTIAWEEVARVVAAGHAAGVDQIGLMAPKLADGS